MVIGIPVDKWWENVDLDIRYNLSGLASHLDGKLADNATKVTT